MGLAIVMGVVKTMNGRISVKSELGLGSLFRITLPVKNRLKKNWLFPMLFEMKVLRLTTSAY